MSTEYSVFLVVLTVPNIVTLENYLKLSIFKAAYMLWSSFTFQSLLGRNMFICAEGGTKLFLLLYHFL